MKEEKKRIMFTNKSDLSRHYNYRIWAKCKKNVWTSYQGIMHLTLFITAAVIVENVNAQTKYSFGKYIPFCLIINFCRI